MTAEPPIACSLSEPDLRDRQEGLLGTLAARAERIVWLEHGVRFALAGDGELVTLLHRVIALERECCRFLRISVAYLPNLGPLEIEITGPPGTRELLETTFGLG